MNNVAKTVVVKTAIVIVVGVAAVLVDRFVTVRSPPGWLLSWAGFIATGWALSFGPRLGRLIDAAVSPRSAGGSRVDH